MTVAINVSAAQLAQMPEPRPYLRYKGNGIVTFDESALGRDAGVGKMLPVRLGTIGWLLTSTSHSTRLFGAQGPSTPVVGVGDED